MRKLTNPELRLVADARAKTKIKLSSSASSSGLTRGSLPCRQAGKKEIYLILDNLRSVHNIGAAFRTADAAGVTRLYLCGICAHPPRPDLEKTALKTIPYVDWKYAKSTKQVINLLRKKGVQIVALEQTDDSIDYRKFKYTGPVAIVVGNEVDGVDQKVLDLCDKSIEIPMHGFANSLNVTTAVGVVLFNLI
jgi:tRNA G18 (ribose-2'-O)-methylase SpoU